MLKIYGIKNCDTIKKALKWAEEKGLEFTFHDYRKDGIDENLAKGFIAKIDLNILINKRGTTWRNLPDDIKDNLTPEVALKVMLENPAIIKRPIFDFGDEFSVGFSKKDQEVLNSKIS